MNVRSVERRRFSWKYLQERKGASGQHPVDSIKKARGPASVRKGSMETGSRSAEVSPNQEPVNMYAIPLTNFFFL